MTELNSSFPHTAIQCLAAVALHHRMQVNPDRLIHEYALTAEEPSETLLSRIARDVGFKAKVVQFTWDELCAQQGVYPILVRLNNGNSVIVVGTLEGDRVSILDPLENMGAVLTLTRDQFTSRWKGAALLLKRKVSMTDVNQPFGLRWFIPEILRQKIAFRDIAIAAIILQVLALASPIFFQLVIDKVLVHQSASTLWVLGVGILLAMVFEAVFGYLRQLLLLAATNKIDIRLTCRTFSHLLSLPIDYFETHSAGVIVRHVQQLESIRNFLTGRLFFTALDTVGLLIFLPILFYYSFKLALIVLVFAIVIATVIAVLLPTFRRRLDALYSAEGKRQALLVETIHGMRTVKALAIEPKQRRTWEQSSAEAINAHYHVGHLGIAGGGLTGFLEKILPVVIIVIGAQDVFDQTMSVGALIAFQMISGRVVSPLTQIVGLINEYQQTALSVRMLGEIMNRPPEGRIGAGGLHTKLDGEIVFDNVTFRYPGATTSALDRAGFRIPAGAVVGIVGRSGSGKTTLTKLIQGLYPVQEGVVRFDGVDAREIDLAHLRKQIGVVLQENFLFRGTVRENISMTRPDATFEEIVEVAQAAGADEFIERLPQGYDSMLEENASNLSGGQKQRLSIARALLSKPRILILDEAASALDPESEAIFINNLSRIAVGKTVVMISHRLSTLVNADAILVMQHGQLMDSGRHEELLDRCSTYQQLWNQQTSHL
jgi:ATP-binding cassette subfamily B protein